MIQLSDFYGYSMYTISSDTLSVSVMSLGATVTRLAYQGRNVVVSLKTPDDYLQDTSYLGAIVGRYANRIAGGRFPLNGKTVQIEQNEGRNHLHGGSVGFHKRIWAAECLGEQAVRFTLHTPDGDAGYPGALTMHVTYRVEGSRLFLDFEGISTKDTILAPTTHMYFNLGGTESILGTTLQINASRWIPVDGELIPTGELRRPRVRSTSASRTPLRRTLTTASCSTARTLLWQRTAASACRCTRTTLPCSSTPVNSSRASSIRIRALPLSRRPAPTRRTIRNSAPPC